MLLRGTGRSTQLHGRVRKESTPLGAIMGVEHCFGGIVDARGGQCREQSSPGRPGTWEVLISLVQEGLFWLVFG